MQPEIQISTHFEPAYALRVQQKALVLLLVLQLRGPEEVHPAGPRAGQPQGGFLQLLQEYLQVSVQ